jgi:pseudaminic acid synthase
METPYLVAELSGNHQGSLQNVLDLMLECKLSGFNAFKLQTFTPDEMTIESNLKEYVVEVGPWNNVTLFDLYSKSMLPISWLSKIFEYGKSIGIHVFSSPFGLKSLDLLLSYDVPVIKIASFELTFKGLLAEIGKTKTPTILSTGMASVNEIESAIETLISNGCPSIALLKCTTTYPANADQLNLSTILDMKEKFKVPIGFSDHSLGIYAAISASAIGADIIEKHVKLDNDHSSTDSSFSLPVSEFKNFVEGIKFAYKAKGSVHYGPMGEETKYLRYRRSVVASRTLRAGEEITDKDVVVVRPKIGADPQDIEKIIGKKLIYDKEKGSGICISDVVIK